MPPETKTVLSSAAVLRHAIRLGGDEFLFVHTHPSGVPFPSKEDIELTDALSSNAKQLGLTLNDHLILGHEARFSFREHKVLQ